MKPTEAPTKAELIAQRNDKFRQGETMSVSQGVFNLQDVLGLIRAVRDYTDFSEDNDPTESMTLVLWNGKVKRFSGR